MAKFDVTYIFYHQQQPVKSTAKIIIMFYIKYRKIVICTRGTINFEALFWAGIIQGRVQLQKLRENDFNCIKIT